MKNKTTPIGRRIRNLGLAAVAAQAGCVTLIIVFSAMLLGLWLDAQFDQRGPFTFAVLILSVPVSLYAMIRIAVAAISRIDLPAPKEYPVDMADVPDQPSYEEPQDTSSESKEV